MSLEIGVADGEGVIGCERDHRRSRMALVDPSRRKKEDGKKGGWTSIPVVPAFSILVVLLLLTTLLFIARD